MENNKFNPIEPPKISVALSFIFTVILPIIGYIISKDIWISVILIILCVFIIFCILFMKQFALMLKIINGIEDKIEGIVKDRCKQKCSDTLSSKVNSIESSIVAVEKFVNSDSDLFDMIELSDDNQTSYMIIINSSISKTYTLELKGKDVDKIKITPIVDVSEDKVLRIKPSFKEVSDKDTELPIELNAHIGTNCCRFKIEKISNNKDYIYLSARVYCDEKDSILTKQLLVT